MYLIHEVMIGFFHNYGPLVTVLGGLSATICFASLSWYLLERRLTQHKQEVVLPIPVAVAN